MIGLKSVSEMETKIDEVVDELIMYKELAKRFKEKIQDEYDLANYNNQDDIMEVLRRIIYFVEGTELEVID